MDAYCQLCCCLRRTFRKRRRVYTVAWPDEVFLSFTRQMKNTIVSIALTSILGAVVQIDLNVQKHQSMQSAQVDARTHARHVMTLASITNLFSSIALFPVYQLIVVEICFSCTDDVASDCSPLPAGLTK